MNSIRKDSIDRLLRWKRYVAFVDVLGYSSLLLERGFKSEEHRVNSIFSLWENWIGTINDVVDDEHFPSVEPVVFSDCLVLISENITQLLTCLTSLYIQTCSFYRTEQEEWMPWLRAGVAFDWVLQLNDPTLPKDFDQLKRFRNPTGPAVAKAYMTGEKTNCKGMRILVPESIKAAFYQSSPIVATKPELIQHYQQLLKPAKWPIAGKDEHGILFDVPWWKCSNSPDDPKNALAAHKWQAEIGNDPKKGREHFERTMRLIS